MSENGRNDAAPRNGNPAGGYRASHLDKGADYARSFAELPHRALLWDLERRALDGVLARHLGSSEVDLLDFACGTGRILSHLAPRVRSATGVDVSASMLAEARLNVPGATLHLADLTVDDRLGDATYGLVTAFRFFPNAEPALRAAGMAALVHHLAPGGVVVFNNHRNDSSLVRRLASLRGRETPEGMSDAQVRFLVRSSGLRIVDSIPLGVLPLTDRRMVGPRPLVERVERVASLLPGARSLAQNLIYVCRRAR